MIRYFAYGSNMSTLAMRRRCPAAVATGRARLDGWRFEINEDGFATVVPAAGCAVHGVLWRVSPRDLAALNAYESVETGLYFRRIVPVRHGGRLLPALVYIGRSRTPGRPRPGYLEEVVAAAREWALPADYVRRLERSAWAFANAGSAAVSPPESGAIVR